MARITYSHPGCSIRHGNRQAADACASRLAKYAQTNRAAANDIKWDEGVATLKACLIVGLVVFAVVALLVQGLVQLL